MAGKEISSKNLSALQQFKKAFKDLLDTLGISEDVQEEEETLTEALSTGDRYTLIDTAMRALYNDAKGYYGYLSDIYDTFCIFSTNGKFLAYPYSIQGMEVVLGEPTEVFRNVAYKTLDGEEYNPSVLQESISIIESDNGYLARLISPGTGSTGFYSAETLQNSLSAFKRGTPMFLNHDTEEDLYRRPEGDINRLAATLLEDGKYLTASEAPDGVEGIYAKVELFPDHKETILAKAKHTGLSILGNGVKALENGKTVIKKIEDIRSIDFVTKAGRGGQLLVESKVMSDVNYGLEAYKIVSQVVGQADLPQKVKEAFIAAYGLPTAEFDTTVFTQEVAQAVETKVKELKEALNYYKEAAQSSTPVFKIADTEGGVTQEILKEAHKALFS